MFISVWGFIKAFALSALEFFLVLSWESLWCTVNPVYVLSEQQHWYCCQSC